jgi:glyoxylase-like metal-dependent hydrolase (beta-lactamase superfamily II)
MAAMRLVAVVVAAVAAIVPVSSQSDTPDFEIQKVVDGVYAAIRRKPPGLMFDANSIFIVNDADVIVVDTNITPTSAKATIAALKKLTPKPVRTIINTHWHDDHMMGNAAYREAFPGVEIIGHARSADAAATTGAANRKGTLERGPILVKQLRLSLEQAKNFDGQALNDEERASYRGDITAAERYFVEAAAATVVAPTVTVTDRMTLKRGKRTIEILHLGAGHTPEDLVVHLPQDRLVITGDLLALPVPLIGSTSRPLEFGATLEKLVALKPAILIPGHGPVVRTLDHVQLEIRLLTSLVEQVKAAVSRGAPIAEVRKSVNLSEFEAAFCGTSRLLRSVFQNYVNGSGIAAAYRDLTKKQ